ncbi:MAG TPA: double zinc ribbon domain-containing protein [Actinomycetota bacterium]|nr:double zinc ribbon domain-containing protein [Actinomycetota bacterium]
MLGPLLDVVFPRRCAGCAHGPWPFCDRCRDALVPLAPPWCRRCGSPVAGDVDGCADCPPPPLRSARAPFLYDGPARQAVHRLKFSGWRDVGPALAAAIAACDPPPVDAVTWVPLARRRLADRGYDQARVLANGLRRPLGVPVRRLLRRTVRTDPQARRNRAERLAAMAGAFEATGSVPARVLLIDDVLTTGATAAACAQALTAAGAREVHLATAARSLHAPALHVEKDRAYPRAGFRPGLWLPGDPPR